MMHQHRPKLQSFPNKAASPRADRACQQTTKTNYLDEPTPQSRIESRSGERKVRCFSPVPYGRVLFVFSLILYITRPYTSLLINGIEVGSNQPLKADLTMFQPRISVKIESCTVIYLHTYIRVVQKKRALVHALRFLLPL